MPRTFNFPVWLQGTPEQQAEEAERQNLARATFTRAKPSEAERLIGRGLLLEKTARMNLENAEGEEKLLAENQLADALAIQGRYPEAAETHHDPARRQFFLEVIAALEMADDEKCDCPDSEATVNNIDLSITPRYETLKVYSPIHKAVVSLVKCSKCGHLNGRPIRSRLITQQAALSESESAQKPVLSDAQVLNATSV